MKKLSTSSLLIPTLLLDGSVPSSESEKSTMLNRFFSSCLNCSVPPLDSSDTDRLQVDSDQCPPMLLCSKEEIMELLQTLDTSKASGPDDISTRMLKETASAIAPSLTTLSPKWSDHRWMEMFQHSTYPEVLPLGTGLQLPPDFAPFYCYQDSRETYLQLSFCPYWDILPTITKTMGILTQKIRHCTRENFLTLNAAKCKSMLITRKRRCSFSNQFCLTLQSVPLDRVYLFKYFGVLISHNLCWSTHISDIVARSKKIVWLNFRKFYCFYSTNTLLLVRPILEYCCHIWDPFQSKDIELLESVQKFASRVCTKQWREPYNSLWTSLRLPLLKERRAVLKLSVLYKYLNGLAVMPPNTFAPLIHSGRNLHSSNNFYLHQPFAVDDHMRKKELM